MPRCTASLASSALDQRDSARPDSAGSSHANALISATWVGGKRPRPPGPRFLIQPRQAFLEPSSSPLPNRLLRAIKAPRDLRVRITLSREQHDLRSHDLAMRPRVLPRSAAQLALLDLAQLNHVLAGYYPQDSPSGL